MAYYWWIALAFVLLAAEITTMNLVIAFFGVSALIVALLSAVGLVGNLAIEVILFVTIGLALVFALRKPLLKRLSKSQKVPIDAGSEFVSETTLDPDQEGIVNYQGTSWTARNMGPKAIKPGDRVKIRGTQGIKLLVERI